MSARASQGLAETGVHLVALLIVFCTAWAGVTQTTAAQNPDDKARPDSGSEDLERDDEPAPPRATASLLTRQPVWIGQKAEVEVALWRDAALFERGEAPPAFGEVRVRNAIALRTEYAPPPELRTDDGYRYLVQKRRYLIFPQAIGVIEVPPIEVSWSSAEDEWVRVYSEPLEMEASLPAGADAGEYLVADSVTVDESIDGDLEHLRVGDSFTRTITIVAIGTDAMLIPESRLGAPDGLAVYPEQPLRRTSIDRGRYEATRVESATYVAEQWGRYTLPEAQVRWVSPSTGTWRTESVDARSFRTRINPSLGFSAFGTLGGTTTRLGVLLALVLLVWAAYWSGRRLFRRKRERAPRSAPLGPSEATLFRRLRRAASSGDAMATLNAAYAWLAARGRPPGEAPTLDALGDAHPEVTPPAEELEAHLFAPGAPKATWNGRTFASAVANARRSEADSADGPADALPALNPR